LRRIGQVLHVLPNNKMLVKAEKIPKIGEIVTDKNKKIVGVTFDIFGPTNSPYITVELKIKEPKKRTRKERKNLSHRV
jgi:rRNA processing protein Gar1